MVWLWAHACDCTWRQVHGSTIWKWPDWNMFCPPGEQSHPHPALSLWASQQVRLEGRLESFIPFYVSSCKFSARRSTASGTFSFCTVTTTTTFHSALLLFQKVKTEQTLQCVQGHQWVLGAAHRKHCQRCFHVEWTPRSIWVKNAAYRSYHAKIHRIILATSFLLSHMMHQAMWLSAG